MSDVESGALVLAGMPEDKVSTEHGRNRTRGRHKALVVTPDAEAVGKDGMVDISSYTVSVGPSSIKHNKTKSGNHVTGHRKPRPVQSKAKKTPVGSQVKVGKKTSDQHKTLSKHTAATAFPRPSERIGSPPTRSNASPISPKKGVADVETADGEGDGTWGTDMGVDNAKQGWQHDGDTSSPCPEAAVYVRVISEDRSGNDYDRDGWVMIP